VLAYLFWHSPREQAQETYEQALSDFHRSLAHSPPIGFLRSACYRTGRLPWMDSDLAYEDWYLIEDYTALGVLGEAAVAHGHRSAHQRLARVTHNGAGGLYRLCEGDPEIGGAQTSIWVTPARLSEQSAVAGLLMADGTDPADCSLWRRELVLGPAPEYCILASERPAGTSPERLPENWLAFVDERVPLWSGK
jgi:hypothetical protein